MTELTVDCPYCQTRQPAPDLEARHRAREEARELDFQRQQASENAADVRRTSRWILIGTLVIALVVSVVSIVLTAGSASTATTSAVTMPQASGAGRRKAATPLVKQQPERPAYPSDDRSNGRERVTALMKQGYDRGCRGVIMPPAPFVDASEGTGTLEVGRCTYFIAASGIAEARLSMSLRTPFGEQIPTPTPAREIVFRYCAKTNGPHPFKLMNQPAGAPYSVAAIGCGSGIKNPYR